MPDISMCKGKGWDKKVGPKKPVTCPMRERCHRYTAQRSVGRQSWFLNIPGERQENGDFTCSHFMETSPTDNKETGQ